MILYNSIKFKNGIIWYVSGNYANVNIFEISAHAMSSVDQPVGSAGDL